MIVVYVPPIIPPLPDISYELRLAADRRVKQIMHATRNTLRVELPRGRKHKSPSRVGIIDAPRRSRPVRPDVRAARMSA